MKFILTTTVLFFVPFDGSAMCADREVNLALPKAAVSYGMQVIKVFKGLGFFTITILL